MPATVIQWRMPDVKELEEEEVDEIGKYAVQAAAFVEIGLQAAPRDVVTAINSCLREIEDGQRSRPDDDTVMGIGILLGTQYTREFAWSWAYVTWDDGFSAHCVTSPDRAYAIAPIQWVNGISKKETTTNVLLNFNMIAAGNVPPSEPGACSLFH